MSTADQSRACVLSAAESLRRNDSQDQFAAQVMAELQHEDALFRYPISKGHTLKDTFADIDPTIKFGGLERLTADESKDIPGEPTQRVTFKTADGAIALVYVNKQRSEEGRVEQECLRTIKYGW